MLIIDQREHGTFSLMIDARGTLMQEWLRANTLALITPLQ
jgi:hypothetical protein